MIKHKHLLVHAKVKYPIIEKHIASQFLTQLVKLIDMKICNNGGPHIDYVEDIDNEGICSIVMLKTSHASCHIWTNTGDLQLDVYSCSDFDPQIVINHITDNMIILECKYLFLDREDLFTILFKKE